jgi:hypothetical protein
LVHDRIFLEDGLGIFSVFVDEARELVSVQNVLVGLWGVLEWPDIVHNIKLVQDFEDS